MRKSLIVTIGLGVILTACSGPKTTIKGEISEGGANRTIWVEEVIPAGTRLIDTLKSDVSGRFTVNIRSINPDEPGFYNLRIGGLKGNVVPLLLAQGEEVRVMVMDSIGKNYCVTGSIGSTLVQEANTILRMGNPTLDSLERLYNETDNVKEEERIAAQYAEVEMGRKQAAIAFLVKNAGSMATIVPLYQPLKGGGYLFGEVEDVIYYRMAADSLQAKYPVAAYTKSLLTDVQRMENLVGGTAMVLNNLDNEVTFPDLEMPDVLGKRRKLSELKGKVILLSFTASNLPEFKVLNRELLDVYNKYAKRGFEIYQVSLDLNKAEWIGGVAEQRLPWISVSDLKGADSRATTLYGVKTLPMNFLINKKGEIVKRGLAISEIDGAVKAEL